MNTAPLKPSDLEFISRPSQPARIAASMLALFLAVSTATREALAQETSTSEAAVEQSENARIAQIEKKFLELEARVLPVVNLYVEDPEIRNKIRRLFEIVRFNRYMQHPAGFRYELVKGMYHPASFHGKNRVLSLPENFDAEDIGSLTMFAHELAHSEHDDEHRAHVPLGRYDAYWNVSNPDGKTVVVVVRDEADAIVRQLELLNVLTHGELKRRARRGLPLEIPTNDDYTRKFLSLFADEYFRTPRTFQAAVERVNRSFQNAVFFTPDLTRIP